SGTAAAAAPGPKRSGSGARPISLQWLGGSTWSRRGLRRVAPVFGRQQPRRIGAPGYGDPLTRFDAAAGTAREADLEGLRADRDIEPVGIAVIADVADRPG